jgi:hypothetical protein
MLGIAIATKPHIFLDKSSHVAAITAAAPKS